MDKELLVANINNVLESFKLEGKGFSFAALVPVYAGLPSTPYVLLLDSDWLQQLSIFDSTKLIIERIFQVIEDPEIRKKIDSVDVWRKGMTYPGGIEAIIIIDDDKISRYFNYIPTPAFSGSLFTSGSIG